MKFAVFLLLWAAFSHAAEVQHSKSKEKEDSKTDKRALIEGNAGVEKRAPVIANALPSATPGIVYADTNQLQDGKSSQQEVYATPLPQLAKISDIFTGQGHHFQSAIASHLFSPVSIYQTRIPGFEVSAPIPSKLAYTEKMTYQPQTQQHTPQALKSSQNPVNLIRVTYPQPPEQFQQIQPQQFQQFQSQPQNQYQQLQAPRIQPVLQYQQQQPQFIQIQPYQRSHLLFNQSPFLYQGPQQFSPQPFAYAQQQLPANVQPGIVYAREEENNEKPIQREQKPTQPQRIQQNVQEKPEQNYNTHNQGAVSYASFSVGLPATQSQTQNQQYESQAQVVQYQSQPQIQYQSPQQYQIQPQQSQTQRQEYQIQSQQQPQRQEPLSQRQYQIQRQPLPQFNQRVQVIQPQQQQIHQQIQPQFVQKSEPASANSVNVPSKSVPLSPGKEQLTYFRPDPVYQQPQLYQGQALVIPNQLPPQQVLAVPTFPPVQFFGKFAHELFRNYQQQ